MSTVVRAGGTGTPTLGDIQALVRDGLSRVGDELIRIVTVDLPLIDEVNSHLLLMKGKMFRPTLVLLASEIEQRPESRAPAGSSVVSPGEILAGRYRVVERLGEGGMGVVYKVEHTRMGKLMALKLLHRDIARERRASALSAARHRGSSCHRRRTARNAPGSFGGMRRPAALPAIASGSPPTRVATTGMPRASASATTMP